MKKYGVRCTCCNPRYICKSIVEYEDCFDADDYFGTDNLNEAYRFFCYMGEPFRIEVFEKNNG